MTGHEVERRALLTPVLLLLLAERQGHGYELVQRLGAFGCADADQAHVYRLLEGYRTLVLVDIVSRGGPPGTLYTIDVGPEPPAARPEPGPTSIV